MKVVTWIVAASLIALTAGCGQQGAAPTSVATETAAPSSEPFNLQLGSSGMATVTGFNAAEEGWRIAMESPATIKFPHPVIGHIEIILSAWMPPDIAATSPVTFTVGGVSSTVQMTGKVAPYTITLDVPTAADELVIESAISHNPASDRPLGVALVNVEVKPQQQ